MKEMWNERFGKEEFVYGKEPNKFFKEQIDKLTPGKLLLLGEGEGRNAVYAAKLGWQVDAIDWSEKGKAKCMKLAEENNVKVNYTVADLAKHTPKNNYYNAVGLIFLHLPPEIREKVHRGVVQLLAGGGRVILESYDKDQIEKSSGGPKNLELLHSLEEIFSDFNELEIEHFSKENIELNESKIHTGPAVVINYLGRKNEE